MEFLTILNKVIAGSNLSEQEAAAALQQIMEGKINATQMAAFLTALKVKGETAEEIAAFAKTMRKNGIRIAPGVKHLVDTAGTGGDGSRTFNISTCAAFVTAGTGACVAKHGNRAASSQSGSADVLEELGVAIQMDPKTAERQLEQIGIAFLFAPVFHPAMKHVAPVRRELGFKTIFNILGPLTNPAGAKRQLIGVYDKMLLEKMAEALKLLGTEKALLVSSDVDEISISSETNVVEVAGIGITSYTLSPEELGFKRTGIGALQVKDRKESAEVIRKVLKGEQGPARDIVLLNAGAAIYASGIVKDIPAGIRLAEKSVDSGKAMEKLNALMDFDRR